MARAANMQPKRLDRVVNEHLYASPAARDEVSSIAEAAARMDRLGFAPAGLGAVAVRRSTARASVTAPGCDLASVDNRQLESVPIDHEGLGAMPVLAGLVVGYEAAAWGYPPYLLNLAISGRVPDLANADLAAVAGSVAVVASPGEIEAGEELVWVVQGGGVLAVGDSPSEAVRRLEAAEALAHLQNLRSSANGKPAAEQNEGDDND